MGVGAFVVSQTEAAAATTAAQVDDNSGTAIRFAKFMIFVVVILGGVALVILGFARPEKQLAGLFINRIELQFEVVPKERNAALPLLETSRQVFENALWGEFANRGALQRGDSSGSVDLSGMIIVEYPPDGRYDWKYPRRITYTLKGFGKSFILSSKSEINNRDSDSNLSFFADKSSAVIANEFQKQFQKQNTPWWRLW